MLNKLTLRKAALAALWVFLLWPVFSLSSNFEEVRVITHHDELFVFINTYYVGVAGPRALLYAGGFIGIVPSRRLREDTIVYHLQGNSLKRYYYKDMCIGTPEVYKDHLYYGEACDKPISLWKWCPNGLKAVAASDAKVIDAAQLTSPYKGFTPGKGISAGNGWQELNKGDLSGTKDYPNAITEKRTSILVGSQKYQVVYQRTPSSDRKPFSEIYSLQGPGLAKPMQTLYVHKWQTNTQFVSWKTYFSIAHNIF